jgi:hypothetical protein
MRACTEWKHRRACGDSRLEYPDNNTITHESSALASPYQLFRNVYVNHILKILATSRDKRRVTKRRFTWMNTTPERVSKTCVTAI